jgi:protein-L-isoaspartate(D-aspartate) O-methyltransferase
MFQEKARQNLEDLGYRNIQYKVSDGSLGWPEEGPYDGILVTAGAPHVPEALTEQLAEQGRLVLPVGDRYLQTLMLVTKNKGQLDKRRLGGCRFVPLMGEQGWGRQA